MLKKLIYKALTRIQLIRITYTYPYQDNFGITLIHAKIVVL